MIYKDFMTPKYQENIEYYPSVLLFDCHFFACGADRFA
jgi:hypothetical protein